MIQTREVNNRQDVRLDQPQYEASDYSRYHIVHVDFMKNLLDPIENAMDKTVSGRDSDETVEAFGGPLI